MAGSGSPSTAECDTAIETTYEVANLCRIVPEVSMRREWARGHGPPAVSNSRSVSAMPVCSQPMRPVLRFRAFLAALLAASLATAPAAGVALGQRHAILQTLCSVAAASLDGSRSRAPGSGTSSTACEHVCCSASSGSEAGPPRSDRALSVHVDSAGSLASVRPCWIYPTAVVEAPQPRGPPRIG